MKAYNVSNVAKKAPVRASRQGLSEGDIRRALEEIIRGFGHDPSLVKVDDLQVIADRLSQAAGKSPAWGWRYLRNVLNAKIEASEKLVGAIFAVGAMQDGVPAVLASSQRVTVQAVGKVKPGSLVLGSSHRCDFPGCPVEFVPVVPWQRYHSAECRIAHRKSLAAGEKNFNREGAKGRKESEGLR